jgi:hypothetical protein
MRGTTVTDAGFWGRKRGNPVSVLLEDASGAGLSTAVAVILTSGPCADRVYIAAIIPAARCTQVDRQNNELFMLIFNSYRLWCNMNRISRAREIVKVFTFAQYQNGAKLLVLRLEEAVGPRKGGCQWGPRPCQEPGSLDLTLNRNYIWIKDHTSLKRQYEREAMQKIAADGGESAAPKQIGSSNHILPSMDLPSHDRA